MADVTLSQEDLDNRIALAVGEATAKYANYDQLQAAATRLQELERSNEDAVQRQIREAREAAQAEVPNLVAQATAGARTTVIEAELRSLAVQHNFQYPDDVVRMLAGSKDITVDDNFRVKGAEKLVKELAVSRPEWIARSFNGAPPRGNGSTVQQTEQERQAAIASAVKYRRESIGAII